MMLTRVISCSASIQKDLRTNNSASDRLQTKTWFKPYWYQTDRQTDRYFIDRNKSPYRLICHSNKRDICTCIYKNVSLLKSYESIYIV